MDGAVTGEITSADTRCCCQLRNGYCHASSSTRRDFTIISMLSRLDTEREKEKEKSRLQGYVTQP